MRKIVTITLISLLGFPVLSQKEKSDCDTTNINLRNKRVIIVDNCDTIINIRKKKSEAHWAGIDFGFTTLMNSSFDNSFSDHPYWKNDPAKSTVWNLNVLEHKFEIAKHHFGVTTGLGFSFTSVGFKDNYVVNHTSDTLNAFIDTLTNYRKNKLSAAYLTVPLLFEFNSNARSSKLFYFAAGVVGGVRIASDLKRKGEIAGEKFVQKTKGAQGLNAFKLDALVRFGYSHWGVFASYSMLPLFDTDKTIAVYPLSFGLSINM